MVSFVGLIFLSALVSSPLFDQIAAHLTVTMFWAGARTALRSAIAEEPGGDRARSRIERSGLARHLERPHENVVLLVLTFATGGGSIYAHAGTENGIVGLLLYALTLVFFGLWDLRRRLVRGRLARRY